MLTALTPKQEHRDRYKAYRLKQVCPAVHDKPGAFTEAANATLDISHEDRVTVYST